jgi:hypothetical protein
MRSVLQTVQDGSHFITEPRLPKYVTNDTKLTQGQSAKWIICLWIIKIQSVPNDTKQTQG